MPDSRKGSAGHWLSCQQCGASFFFSVAEQANYDRRGFDPPLRCPECRKHRNRIDDDESWNPRQKKKRRRDDDDY